MRVLRSDVGRWALVSLAVVVLGIVGVVRTPGPDTSVMGRVAGFGFKLDGSACYLTVAYSVDGRDLHFRTPSERRWCGYNPRDRPRDRTVPVLVFYDVDDVDDVDDATLTPRGRGPAVAIGAGLAGLTLCGFRAGRRNRRQRRKEPAAEVSGPSTPASASRRTP
ncbi:hypothetical protein GCM10009623_32910 [Nocardioides aestuarii]|uniref:DUF3592 domain-containing protein n=1 Tax=Nocardioides aestuarii TaxID=252231 RepID=A0ABW4TPU4_9ACTN